MLPATPFPEEESFSERLEALDELVAQSTTPNDLDLEALDPDLQSASECLGILEADRRRRMQRAVPIFEAIFGPLPFGESLGRFQIRKLLGRGGHGTVLLGYDPERRIEVALKIPHIEVVFTPNLRKRFIQEAEIARGLDHPNLAKIYDVPEVGYYCFLVMEYVQGWSLAQVIKRLKRTINPFDAATLVATLAEAVEAMHSKRIYHRDLKPSNIMVYREGETSRESDPLLTCKGLVPKVIDYGLAMGIDLEEHSLTNTGVILGTASYMAPELALGRKAGPAADIYSLGVILYEILAGQPPFGGDTDAAILRRVVHELAPSLRRSRSDVPVPLARICGRCLEKEETARFASAAELAFHLRRFVEGDPVVIPPPALKVRCSRWLRRMASTARPMFLVPTLVLVIGLMFGLIPRSAPPSPDPPGSTLAPTDPRFVYEKRILEVEHAWAQKRLGDMRELLVGMIPGPNERDLRGFEWYYLWSRCREAGLILSGSEQNIRSVVFFPDGKKLASGDQAGSIHVWDLQHMKYVGAFRDGHINAITQLFFSSVGNLVSKSSEGTVRHWSLNEDGALVCHKISLDRDFRRRESNLHYSSILSPDALQVADFTKGEGVRLVDLVDAARIVKLQRVADHENYQPAAYSKDGKKVACIYWGHVQVWNSSTGAHVGTDNRPLLKSIEHAAFIPNSDSVLVGYPEGNVLSCNFLAETKTDYPWEGRAVNGVAAAPDGSWVGACGSKGPTPGSTTGFAKIWQTKTGGPIAEYSNPTGRFSCLSVAPDGNSVAMGSDDSNVHLYSLHRVKSLPAHKAEAWSTAFSPDGKVMATGGDDDMVRIWDTTDWKIRVEFPKFPGLVSCLAFSPDGKALATSDFDGNLILWDWKAGTKILTHKSLPNHHFRLLAFSPNGKCLAATVEPNPSHSGKFEVWVWSMDQAKSPQKLTGFRGNVYGLAFCGDEELVAGDLDGRLLFHNLSSDTSVSQAIGQGQIYCAAANPSEEVLALGTNTGTLELWEPASHQQRWSVGNAHAKEVMAVAIAPDGKSVASIGTDSCIRIWSVVSGACLLTIDGQVPSSKPQSLTFSPDGSLLVSSHHDGSVHFWHAGR